MKKLEYFIDSISKGLHEDRIWLLRVLALPTAKTENLEFPYLNEETGQVGFMQGEEFIALEDVTTDKPIYSTNEKVHLKAGNIINLKKDLDTSYRIALLNAIILGSVFGDQFEYVNEIFSGKVLDVLMEEALRSDEITVAKYKEFMRAMGFITFLADVAIPTSSDKALRSSPVAKQVRDKLVEKYKDQLDDPVIVAKIDEEIIKVLKKELEGDEAEGFFIKGKQINKVRKMTHGMIGGFSKLEDGTKVDTIVRSLEEGWIAEDLPALINQLRAGSYDRGKDTALGGEAANFSTRIGQNLKIIEPDCGSVIGLPVIITIENHEDLDGMYQVGHAKPLTEEKLKGMIGKKIYVRSPMFCWTANGDFCEKCFGDKVAKGKVGLGPQLTAVTSVFLSISLASFHGKELKTVKYNHLEALS